MSASGSNRRQVSRTARISQDLKTVLAVTRAMSLEHDLGRLLDLIVSSASDLVQADRASLFLVDEQRNQLWTRIAQGSDEIRLPMGLGIAGAVAMSGEVVNIADAYADPRFSRENDRRTGYRTQSILCLPLINHENRIIGVLQALNKRADAAGLMDKPTQSRLQRAVRQYEHAIQAARPVRHEVVKSGITLINASFEAGDYDLCQHVIQQLERDKKLDERERNFLHTMKARLTMMRSHEEVRVQAFSGHDEEVLAAFCAQAAVAIDNTQLIARDLERQQLLRDLDLAHRIQQQLLPSQPPEIPGWRLAAWHHGCDQVSGDYHDFLPWPSGACDLVIGDVSGHGLGAALMMSTARAFLLGLCQHDQDLAAILERLNNLLERDMADDAFMTMVLCRLGPDGAFRWSSAGHEPPLVYRVQDGTCAQAGEDSGLMLGALPDSVYAAYDCEPLRSGDLLVLATDGLHETIDERTGQEFGWQRVQDVVREHGAAGAEVLLERLRAALDAHRGEESIADDVTLLIAERL